MLQLFLSLGVVVIYALSSINDFRYFDQSLILVGFVTIFTILMPFFCETPRWLLAHGRKDEAIAVLKFLRGPKFDSSTELKMIQVNIASTPKLKTKQTLKEFTKGNVIVPMVLAILSAVFLQSGGLNAIVAFSALILQSAGVPSFRQIALYGTGCTRLILNMIIVFLADIIGRKVLLFISSIGTFLGTTMLGVHFYITDPSFCSSTRKLTNSSQSEVMGACNSHLAPLAIAAIVVYNIGFSIGWGPVIWLLLGELLPLQIRGIGNGIAVFVMWIMASILIGSYESYAEAVQPWFVWWTYSVVNFVSLLFVVFCLFETKGKSLEDIQRRFDKKYGQFRLCFS